MLNRIWPHLTYANVMTTVLLFIVLGGGAYAVSGKNSVTSEDIKNGEVKTADLDNGAVTGKKVDDDSLGAEDLDSLVAGLGGDSDVSSGEPNIPVPYPLADDTWSQPKGEVELLTGTVNFTTPASCQEFGNPDPGAFGNGTVTVRLGGGRVLSGYLPHLPANTVRTSGLSVAPTVTGGQDPLYLFGKPSDTEHTITAEVEDSCAGAADNFVVHSITVDVIAVG